jgi:hypothetical protein
MTFFKKTLIVVGTIVVLYGLVNVLLAMYFASVNHHDPVSVPTPISVTPAVTTAPSEKSDTLFITACRADTPSQCQNIYADVTYNDTLDAEGYRYIYITHVAFPGGTEGTYPPHEIRLGVSRAHPTRVADTTGNTWLVSIP